MKGFNKKKYGFEHGEKTDRSRDGKGSKSRSPNQGRKGQK